jgi:DNA (cytosine-5)-methyltransferase 1
MARPLARVLKQMIGSLKSKACRPCPKKDLPVVLGHEEGRARGWNCSRGVGGFRIGLERASARYRTVWNNQWEPATRRQVASAIYPAPDSAMPATATWTSLALPQRTYPTMTCWWGGFPCQDYSVARSLNSAGGLQGKKGVLFWEIHRILREKRPPHLMLENVDRMLKSPGAATGGAIWR